MGLDDLSTGPGTVAVVGGGIAGLATAYRLAAGGARVTLFEGGTSLGGLGDTFDFEGQPLERFYHCMLPSDRHLLALLDEIGLDAPDWRQTSFGILRRNQLYRLDTPADLLRFAPLPVMDRVRVGLTGAWGAVRPERGLDEISCEQWLTALSGPRAFERFWRPMLEAKFGDRYGSVPALWFWTRFNREKGGKVERKGYPAGGYRRIADRLGDRLRTRGVSIRMREPVQRLTLGENGRPLVVLQSGAAMGFDRVVYAGPIALLPRIADAAGLRVRPGDLDRGIDMQGVINLVLILRRGLTPHYWVATVDDGVPFQGVVETTTLIDPARFGGRHLVYLTRYLHRDDPLFAGDEQELARTFWTALRRLFPALRPEDLVASRLFRSPYVEPIYQLGYLRRKPPVALVPDRFYLATTAQVYPEVTSWNGSVGLANEVADTLLADARASGLRAIGANYLGALSIQPPVRDTPVAEIGAPRW